MSSTKKQLCDIGLNENVVTDVSVQVEPVLTDGTEIAKIDGTTIYAPRGTSVDVSACPITTGECMTIAKINDTEISAPTYDLSPYAKTENLTAYLPLSGGTLSGGLHIKTKNEALFIVEDNNANGLSIIPYAAGIKMLAHMGEFCFVGANSPDDYSTLLPDGSAVLTQKTGDDKYCQLSDNYLKSIPAATSSTLGGVMVGKTLSASTDGLLNVLSVGLDKIMFQDNFTMAGNYTFGLIKTTPSAIYTISAGTSLLDFMISALSGKVDDGQPQIVSYPRIGNLTLTGVPSGGKVKVGETVQIGWNASFVDGQYKTELYRDSKIQQAGTTATTYTVTFKGQTKTGQSGNFDSVTLQPSDVGTLSVSVNANYSDGLSAKTYRGTDTSVMISAGTTPTVSRTFQCYQETYFCHLITSTELLSSALSDVTDDNLKDKANENYLTEPNPFTVPFEISDKHMVAFYVTKTKQANGMQIGLGCHLAKREEYSTEKYNCFAVQDAEAPIPTITAGTSISFI